MDVKGSATVLKATDLWITSNLHPRFWYPDLDEDTLAALMRRLEVTEFPFSINCSSEYLKVFFLWSMLELPQVAL